MADLDFTDRAEALGGSGDDSIELAAFTTNNLTTSLVGCMNTSASATAISFSDDQSNTWDDSSIGQQGTGNRIAHMGFAADVSQNVSTTVTATMTDNPTSYFPGASVHEIEGDIELDTDASNPVKDTGSTQSDTSNSLTLANASRMVVNQTSGGGTNWDSGTDGWTLVVDLDGAHFRVGHQHATSGSHSISYDGGSHFSTLHWILAAFKIAGGGAATISPTGLASAEAFGSPTINVGGVTISPGGIASLEAFGSHTLAAGVVLIEPSAIATAEAFGSHSLALGPATISPTGIASLEAFGSLTINVGGVAIAPAGIASLEAFGSHVLTTGFVLTPSGIASLEAFGSHTINVGGVTIIPNGIVSAEVFGSHQIVGGVIIIPSGIATAEVFGSATLVPGGVTLLPPGLVSAEAFGNLIVLGGDEQLAGETMMHLWRWRRH